MTRPRQLLLLAGGGHSHALLLRRWLMRPQLKPKDTQVVLVNRGSTALYSGMVPGLVAGLYGLSECSIDLRDLCARAGVTFVRAEITGLDLPGAQLLLAGRPPLAFDRLSLDLGCQTREAAGQLGVKPLEPFLAWLQQAPRAIRIRGGGAAAVELALALVARGHQPRLLLRSEQLHLGSSAANRAGERLLAEAGIPLSRRVGPDTPADLACTGSEAPPWLAASGLPCDPLSGRVWTEPSLAVEGHPQLFASGDCGLIRRDPRPASGVWAVRAAPLLARNLKRSIEEPQRRLTSWHPQARALQLLGDGGARAVAFYGARAFGPSRLLWRWKQRIDRRFMEGFARGAAMAGGEAMACRGCAAKVAADPLQRALARLEPEAGCPPPEDAAVLASSSSGALLLQSLDGFPALVDDPWLNARLTTLHASSDLWACGAQLQSVQALVTLPEASASLQQELLFQTLAGVRSVLDPLGVPLLGGHTLEGRDGAGLGLSLSVNGSVAPERHWPKGPLQDGQVLVLTRPIGTGVLFAAAMAGLAKPTWIDSALETMQQNQAPLVELLQEHGCRACTDITGFGLLGHLAEMLGAGQVVELDPGAVAALPGARELLAQGQASTLAPSNARALAHLDPGSGVRCLTPATAVDQQLWIDPQTCGPLLAALPASRAEAALARLRAMGFAQAAVIARVLKA